MPKRKTHKTQPAKIQKGFLSLLRYPGGKSWFLKTARKWLKGQKTRPWVIVEPFGGGASISLTAVAEDLVGRASFAERDRDVAAIWETALNGEAVWLKKQILSFKMSRKRVEERIDRKPANLRQRAFQCLLRNRTARGGVIAEGAGLIQEGEDGKGISSRWYPDTLAERLTAIAAIKHRIEFKQCDGFTLVRKFLQRKRAVFFVDPPYTQAEKRLYTHWNINHEALFELLGRAKGDVLMTYDDTAEIRALAGKNGFRVRQISMRTSHHKKKRELMISRGFGWL